VIGFAMSGGHENMGPQMISPDFVEDALESLRR